MAAVHQRMKAFVRATEGAVTKITCSQDGHFVALCRIGQIYKHFPNPKPSSYVAQANRTGTSRQRSQAGCAMKIDEAGRVRLQPTVSDAGTVVPGVVDRRAWSPALGRKPAREAATRPPMVQRVEGAPLFDVLAVRLDTHLACASGHEVTVRHDWP